MAPHLRVALAVAASAALAATVHACGFTTHMLVSHRAFSALYSTPRAPSLHQLLENNKGALYGGSPYPDYLYACGSNHDNGEFTHWSPFQAAAANYMLATYSRPWNASGDALAAFMTGVVSHYAADISWHGLAETPSGLGLIESIAGMDFNATGDLDGRAHTEADTGGEFVAAYISELDFDNPLAWTIPVQDLLNIYYSVNRTDVHAGDIEECAAIFFAGSEAIKAAAALAEPLELASSPTLAESYMTMPVGGVDDMAILVGRMWARWAEWMVQGPPVPLPGNEYHSAAVGEERRRGLRAMQRLYRLLGPAFLREGLVKVSPHPTLPGTLAVGRASDGSYTTEAAAQLFLSEARRLLAGGEVSTAGRRATGGWTARTAEEAGGNAAYVAEQLRVMMQAAGAGHVLAAAEERARASYGSSATTTTSSSSSTSDESSDVGSKVAITALLDVLDVLEEVWNTRRSTGSATTSAVAVGAVGAPSAAVPSVVLASAIPLEYAGSALAAGDFDGDGYTDVVVGAYGHSLWTDAYPTATHGSVKGAVADGQALLPQSGGWYTHYGNASFPPATTTSTTASPASIAGAVGAASYPDPQPLPVDFASLGGAEYSRLGSGACTLDFNGDGVDDLAVAAPMEGWTFAADPYREAPTFRYGGRLHIFLGRKGTGLAAGAGVVPDFTIFPTGAETNETFLAGGALLCADVTGDGLPDIVAGSPYAQLNTVAVPLGVETGRVDIFYASRAYGPAQPAAPTAPTMLPLGAANLTIWGSAQYEWMGYSAAVLSNASAAAAHIQASTRIGTWLPAAAKSASRSAPASTVPAACASLAASVAAEPVDAAASTSSLLLVGSPGYRSVDPSLGFASVGRISAFVLPWPGSPSHALAQCISKHATGNMHAGVSGGPLRALSPAWSITADRALTKAPGISTKLGAGVAVGFPLGPAAGPFLAVGMPALDLCNSSGLLPNSTDIFNTSSGVVTVLPLSSVPLAGDIPWTAAANTSGPFRPRAVLAATLPDAHFGWHVAFADATGHGDGTTDLLVAAPMYTPFFLGSTANGYTLRMRASARAALGADAAGDSGRESGAVYLFRGGAASFPTGRQCNAEAAASWFAEGAVQYGRLGSSMLVADYDADGQVDLLLGAPRAAVEVPPQMGGDAATRVGISGGDAEYAGAVLVFKGPLA